jgi:hypothetical protein
MVNNVSGTFNTAVGLFSMQGGQSGPTGAGGSNNVALGYAAMYYQFTGSQNTAIGTFAMCCNTTGNNNVAVGLRAAHLLIVGNNNVAIGVNSLNDAQLGDNNIAIGLCAGYKMTTGSNNTIIGQLPMNTGTTSTVLIGAGTIERIKVNSAGLFINGVPYVTPATAPYTTTTYVTPYTPVANANVRIVATGTITINAPAAAGDGDTARLWIISSGTNTCTLFINTATIRIPTSSQFVQGTVIASGLKARVALQYDADRAKWEFVTFVNGY